MMKLILPLVFLFLALLLPGELSAATLTDVNILEATENIRYLSQEITKKYLYLFANPKKGNAAIMIHGDLEKLVANIRTISISTGNKDVRNVLEFIIYNKNQIEILIQKKPDREKAALMLDYSETLLEGANFIASKYRYNFAESEKMLILGKHLKFLLERSSKYYMALGVGLGDILNQKQMESALQELEVNLKKLEAHSYPSSMLNEKNKLHQAWKVTKSFFDRQNKLFAPNLVVLSTNEMEQLTTRFIDYYRNYRKTK